MGSFNTFGGTTTTYSGGKNVWHEIKAAYPVGGIVSLSSYSVGTVIPAGSMCILNQVTHAITIVAASDTENLEKVNGLLQNDIYVDQAAKGTTGVATGSVVYAGEIYVDRLAEDIPAAVLANLPMIVALEEA